MNKDIFQGKWMELKGKVKKEWGKLTDNDLALIKGTQEEVFGLIQKRYGYEKERAEREVREFIDKVCK
jgi:uncharacterized protein YjbJ (UPF0337 family)